MDKFRAMELFVRVVETGGITRAADSLQLPKATAATLLQKLEASLGVKLLNRTTRRVSVTPDGAAYYERCVSILAQVRETEESLASQHATPRGRLRVDVPTLMARSVFVPALPAFFAKYPDIELALASNERRADLSSRKGSIAPCGAGRSKIRVTSRGESGFCTSLRVRHRRTSRNTGSLRARRISRIIAASTASRPGPDDFPNGRSQRTASACRPR
jgi:DNA-binding transcriptional LysR family regulator